MNTKNIRLQIKYETILFIFVTICLISIAGFRPLEYFRDTSNYLIMIHTYDNIFQSEPTFWLINQFNKLLLGGKDQIFFLLYAILGVGIKIVAIRRLSSFPFLSIYLYICLYFILHEMTQIRVGVATGIFLLAIPDIINKNLKSYLFKTILAMSFHYSAIIMLPLYFINSNKINKKLYYILPLVGILLSFCTNIMLNLFNQLTFFLPLFIAEKIETYIFLLEQGKFNDINLYNIFTLSLIVIYYIFLFNINIINTKLNIILIKLLAIQIFVYYACSSIPTFSFRLSGFIGISLIILIPNLILIFKQRIITAIIIIIWSSAYLWFISINKLIILE